MTHGKLVGTTYVKYEKESEKLRMAGGAWSINLDELPQQTTAVRYITESATYEIPLEDAHLRGFERILGGERKLVVPLASWIVKQHPKTL